MLDIKNDRVKKFVFIAIAVLIMASLALYQNIGNNSNSKYEVTVEPYNGSIELLLKMVITGPVPANDIMVTLTNPEKRYRTVCIEPADMMLTESTTVFFDFTDIAGNDGIYVLKMKSDGKTICAKDLKVIFGKGRRVSVGNTNSAGL